MRIVRTLDNTKAEKESGIAPLLHEVAERITRRGMVIIISDLFDEADPLIESLHHLRHKRHEVVLLQTMAHDELEFPFRKWSLFENLEMTSRPHAARSGDDAGYLSGKRSQPSGEDSRSCRQVTSQSSALNTSQPFDEALMMFLGERAGKKRDFVRCQPWRTRFRERHVV